MFHVSLPATEISVTLLNHVIIRLNNKQSNALKKCRYRPEASVNVHIKLRNRAKFDLSNVDHGRDVGTRQDGFISDIVNLLCIILCKLKFLEFTPNSAKDKNKQKNNNM